MKWGIPAMALVVASAASCSRHPKDGVARGQELYEQRCALCHAKTGASAQGPGLAGVIGRKAAGNPGFGNYSSALRSSGLVWDAASLDRFLSAPSTAVPGTSMAIALPDASDRRAILAYMATFAAPSPIVAADGGPSAPFVPVAVAAPGLREGKAAFAGFRDDGPGVQRHLRVADLPAPFATESVSKGPRVVPRPAGAELHVPAGFEVDLFAQGLENPRVLRVAPDGDIFVAESDPGRIHVLRAADGARVATDAGIFARGLSRPFGIAFYPPGPDPQWVYIAETDAIVRYPYRNGDVVARGELATIVPKLTSTSGGHWTRDIAFSPDGQKLYVSIGSASNVAEAMPKKSVDEAHAWETAEATHGVGAAWGDEEHRADVVVMSPDGSHPRTFATGLRNCVGLALAPGKPDVWCATNERDGLGDDLVPDYVTRVRDGAYYGWPWFYLGAHEDPRLAGQRPDLAGKALVPDVLLQPHSASLQIAFYDAAMFPPGYRGHLFATLHGSWNREPRTGYKVVRIPVADGEAAGTYEDFLTGFVVDDDTVWGRPVGVAVAHDGALLVGEDGNGTIWRVRATR